MIFSPHKPLEDPIMVMSGGTPSVPWVSNDHPFYLPKAELMAMDYPILRARITPEEAEKVDIALFYPPLEDVQEPGNIFKESQERELHVMRRIAEASKLMPENVLSMARRTSVFVETFISQFRFPAYFAAGNPTTGEMFPLLMKGNTSSSPVKPVLMETLYEYLLPGQTDIIHSISEIYEDVHTPRKRPSRPQEKELLHKLVCFRPMLSYLACVYNTYAYLVRETSIPYPVCAGIALAVSTPDPRIEERSAEYAFRQALQAMCLAYDEINGRDDARRSAADYLNSIARLVRRSIPDMLLSGNLSYCHVSDSRRHNNTIFLTILILTHGGTFRDAITARLEMKRMEQEATQEEAKGLSFHSEETILSFPLLGIHPHHLLGTSSTWPKFCFSLGDKVPGINVPMFAVEDALGCQALLIPASNSAAETLARAYGLPKTDRLRAYPPAHQVLTELSGKYVPAALEALFTGGTYFGTVNIADYLQNSEDEHSAPEEQEAVFHKLVLG